MHGNQEMPSETIEVSMVSDSNPQQENVNEQLLKEIDEIYSPVLKLMKLFGIYFGDTSLIQLMHATGSCRKRVYLERFYCGVVVSGFWLNVVIAFVDIFLGDKIFIHLMVTLWCLFIALSGTICLIVLCTTLSDTKKTRFEYFIRGLLAVNSNVNLVKAKNKSRKGLIAFCFSFTFATAGSVCAYLVLGFDIASVFPWNQLSGFWVVPLVFIVVACGVWFLPVLFFFVTCLILEEVFSELRKRMSSSRSISMDLASLKKEYHKLCEVVELADKVLAPLLLGMISVYTPLICFNFYQVANLPQDDQLMFLTSNTIWILTGAGIFAIIMLFGSNVSEKVYDIGGNLVYSYSTVPISRTFSGNENCLEKFGIKLQRFGSRNRFTFF